MASVTKNNKRECTISLLESALFTFKTMEKRNLFFFFSKRIISLYLKAEKEKNKDMQHRGTELQVKETKKKNKQTNYKDRSGIR